MLGQPSGRTAIGIAERAREQHRGEEQAEEHERARSDDVSGQDHLRRGKESAVLVITGRLRSPITDRVGSDLKRRA
jgi:hypothetical protein